jgi:hypothetical protein
MVRLQPEQRSLLGKLSRTNVPKNLLMTSFSVSRTTVWYWGKQNLHYVKNLPRNYKFKITVETEITIIAFRNNFSYGTARIQQRLFCAPDFELEQMEVKVQGVELSRQAINEVLKKWGINGYRRKNRNKIWKFFRALYPNELWQVDLKEFKFEGKKYYLLVCIDDYSRYILCLHLFDHCPTTNDLTSALQKLNVKPENILADNGGQFREQWKSWCIENGIEPKSAHLYYPQDKGKVERTIRNITEEFIDLLKNFPMFFSRMEEYRKWFNEKRFHRGVKDYPANLFVEC